MTIRFLRVEFRPWLIDKDELEITVEVNTETEHFSYKKIYSVDHFEDMFSRFMQDAEYKIKKLIKQRSR